MLSLILTLILNLYICCSVRLECLSSSLTMRVWEENCKNRRKVGSFPKAQNIITCMVEGLLTPAASCLLLSAMRPTLVSWSFYKSGCLQTTLPFKPHPFWVFSLSRMSAHWCQNPGGSFPSIAKSGNFYFWAISLILHFSPFPVLLPSFKLSLYISFLYYPNSLLSPSQFLFFLSQQLILCTGARVLIKCWSNHITLV